MNCTATFKVVLEYVPGGTTQDELAVRVAAGAAPDVIVLADLVLAEWAGSGALVQLDPYMERDGFSMDQFWPSSTAAVTWLGQDLGFASYAGCTRPVRQ